MKGTMDEYIDEIRSYDQKLEAVGYHVDDDDLAFYALKGLPEEYKPVRSALNAKGDIVFNDLATILKNEESQIARDEGLTAPKAFLTTQKNHEGMMSSQSSDQSFNSTATQLIQNGQLGGYLSSIKHQCFSLHSLQDNIFLCRIIEISVLVRIVKEEKVQFLVKIAEWNVKSVGKITIQQCTVTTDKIFSINLRPIHNPLDQERE